MSEKFMHVGRFVVKPESRDAFITIMQDYENKVTQKGLDHSNLIESENKPHTFWHVTVWNARNDWVAIEETPGHLDMHKKRAPLLQEPADHDFNYGRVII